MQFYWCCHEWRFCNKECDNCNKVTKEEKEEERKQREIDRRIYKLWATLNGEKVEGED